ncbi:uncharacterized protein BO80DRAFT_346386, partial [Aspergillus ibericus CBS 121593]
VLIKLYKARFFIKMLKYKFIVFKTKFLNLIINSNKFSINQEKIKIRLLLNNLF